MLFVIVELAAAATAAADDDGLLAKMRET